MNTEGIGGRPRSSVTHNPQQSFEEPLSAAEGVRPFLESSPQSTQKAKFVTISERPAGIYKTLLGMIDTLKGKE